MRTTILAGCVAGMVSALVMQRAWAQEAAPDGAAESATPPSAAEILVTAIRYRDRSTSVAPVLEYGLDYFQRFEPLTVGDMLKRTPSTAFLSDVLEFDGVRLRGLDLGYTQVLINGEKVPGDGSDRSFFVDRIPAELIERVEIVRSASANRSGDAVAGALNIVMRDPWSFEGAFLRAGVLHFDDGEVKPVLGGLLAGPIGEARGIIGFNLQGRHNPKTKRSVRFEPNAGVLEFDNREDQSDVRDGTDFSFNAGLNIPVGAGMFDVSGFYVRTDRTETELSFEFEDEVSGDPADIITEVPQFEDIRQDSYTVSGKFTHPLLGGDFTIKSGFAQFTNESISTEEETEFDPFPTIDDFGGTREFISLRDREWSVKVAQEFQFAAVKLEVGVDYLDKNRDGRVEEAEIDTPGDPFPAPGIVTGGFFSIDERRIDPYAMIFQDEGTIEWEVGVRYESTDTEITDREALAAFSNDYGFVLPSAHVRVNLTDDDRITLSVARTLRRPDFDALAPALLEEEPTEDNDLRGNPLLDPEQAWGVDLGYERRLGRSGVVGINAFYRDVTDRIELASTGVVSSSGDGFIFEPRNVGDGKVWGIELDLSTPLSFVGLEHTGVFLNYSWLNSDIVDPITGTSRRFNDQAKSVLNVGFIQDLPAWQMAFGSSFRKQGEAFSRVQGETVETRYGGDLEAFIEKRFGDRFTLRFTGSNLLDASKDEVFNKWDTLADQLSGDINDLDEFEIETETSGPVFQVVGRFAF